MKSNSEASDRWVPQLVRRLCDGGCETHQGEVKRVRVHHGSKDWGWWNYCDEARAEDKRRGMTVEFENVSCSQCGRDFGPGEHGFSHCADHSPTNERGLASAPQDSDS